MGETLSKMMGRVNQVSQLVSEIAEGASERSNGLAEINTGMVQLDQVTQHNAAMVEEASPAFALLDLDTGNLSRVIAAFKLSCTCQQIGNAALQIWKDFWDNSRSCGARLQIT